MPLSIEPASNRRVPAWRRLGLTLDSERRRSAASNHLKEAEPGPLRETISESVTTTEIARKRRLESSSTDSKADQSSTPNGSGPANKRKKSVSFTPETKEIDGGSNEHRLKEWAEKQNGGEGEFSSKEASEFLNPINPKAAKANGEPTASPTKKSEKTEAPNNPPKKEKSKKPKEMKALEQNADEQAQRGQTAYLNYVVQYQIDRSGWKFNKSLQTKLLKHIFDVSRVPESYEYAVLPYVSGLQSEGMRTRLKEDATKLLGALPKTGEEDIYDIPDDDGVQQRQRKRAEVILQSLLSDASSSRKDNATPSIPKERSGGHSEHLNGGHEEVKIKEKKSRKRKTRAMDG